MLKLIVGLGNPGSRYRFSRHNLGFLALDELSVQNDIAVKKNFAGALIGEGRIEKTKVILAKPQSYMNLSGPVVRSLSEYFRVETGDVMVIHDDLDLPFGALRLKRGGGHGGHKGLGSVISSLGNPDFIRLRLGIGKPDSRITTENYVLEFFSPEEMTKLQQVVADARQAIEVSVSLGLTAAMNRYNARVTANDGDGLGDIG